jgi:hypothetical protein
MNFCAILLFELDRSLAARMVPECRQDAFGGYRFCMNREPLPKLKIGS